MNDCGIYTLWRPGRMSPVGYEQTLDRPCRNVCFPLVSGPRRTEFPKPWVLRPLTAQKQTSETLSPEVWL